MFIKFDFIFQDKLVVYIRGMFMKKKMHLVI